MFSKALTSLFAAWVVAEAALAQVEEGGLGAVDPWGLGFLKSGEAAMPTNMWRASSAEDLLPLMANVRTSRLTPAERTILRRVVVSPAAKPRGDAAEKLLAERARILFELGEAEAAAALYTALDNVDGVDLDPRSIAVDLQLALGNEADACRNLLGIAKTGDFWIKLRAVCAVLKNDTRGAELATELAQAEGVDDPWFFNAAFAASGDIPAKPEARFDSGLDLALSTKAGLEPPRNAIISARPDLAAAMARRDSLAPELRVIAAGVSAEAGILSADDHRSAYRALLAQDGFRPGNAVESAFIAGEDSGADTLDKARALSAALRSGATDAARYSAVSRLFLPLLDELPQSTDTARYAPEFTRAAIAAGDLSVAKTWALGVEVEGGPEADAFEQAYLDGLILMAETEIDPASIRSVAERLVETASDTTRKRAAARMVALWTALGHPLPLEARRLIAAQRDESGEALSTWDEVRLSAAAKAGAAGEVVIAILAATRGEPGRINPAEMTLFLSALGEIGAEDTARQLALEATRYWRKTG
ncbi:MAG: hypothetical protein AAFQ85_04720 [Pseudomonadota bacterium]